MAEFIVGMADFKRKLDALDLSMQRKALTDAAKAGGKILREEAASRAPEDSGDLARGMTLRVAGKENDIREGSVHVGPSRKQFYGLFQEFGTRFHRAQPFLGPALDARRDDIDKAIKAVLLEIVRRFA